MKSINWTDHLLNFISVILGVSMAFYVNSWSAERSARDESVSIIASLIAELDRDIAYYENTQIENNKQQAQTLRKAIGDIKENKLDSLPYYLQGSIGYRNYTPRKVIFNSITSSGKLSLIDDYDLQIEISSFYDAFVSEAEFRGTAQVNFYNNHFMPLMIESSDLLNPDLQDIDLRKVSNLLILYLRIIEWKIDQYERVLINGQRLKENLLAYKDQIDG